MRLPAFPLKSVSLRGQDAEAYRDKARVRDQIVLRSVSCLVITGQISRLFFDLNLTPETVHEGLGYRIGGVLCFVLLFAGSFHRISLTHLHALVAAGYLLGTAALAMAHAMSSGPAPFVNTTIGAVLILLGAFSFQPRLVMLVGFMAVMISLIHMPLLGLGVMGVGSRLFGSGLVVTITLTGSWLLDQHWRRAFLVERDLAWSHENLRRAHRELAEAHATLKDTQAQLVNAEKTAALGRLVAGLAHRINAPVGIQVSLSSHLADTTGWFSRLVADGSLRRADLERFLDTVRDTGAILQDNAQRMARLVDAFKQLEASAEQEVTVLDLHDLLAHSRPLIQAMMPPGIALVVDVPAGLTVRGAWNLLDTILHQTVGNALRHAFPEPCAGTVTIRAGRDDGGSVVLTVTDDGCGIGPEHLKHVFDPFYTDGAIGGSQGLGLSIVHNAVVGPLGGRIAIESRRGAGTSVIIRLPAAGAPAPEEAAAPAPVC